jgi:hypothetical protein
LTFAIQCPFRPNNNSIAVLEKGRPKFSLRTTKPGSARIGESCLGY